ncbi:MAG: undecaprenyl-phosphate alpha-N-acetylglucosaminyl 1-phosphate transferase [Saprospiraceae bacterium]|nr:MAG: undecaprenyl-phosphate alpha-N-acetylglucosaminyl 1-phosphate transferase [Saprospiraceae bacterium]
MCYHDKSQTSHDMYTLILSFLTAFSLTYAAIPSIIEIARKKNLVDEPVERSSHTISTPSLGGIAIFAGAIFSIVLWTPFNDFGNLQYILCSFIIVFLIGAKDDISPVSPVTKLIGQFMAAFILVFKSNILLISFYGLFNIDTPFPEWIAAIFSLFTILVIVNAFNLIDGINGLAGSIGSLIAGTLGIWFFLTGHIEYAIVAFSLVGAVVGFLKYNYTPAKIFMGDTGALLVGLICAILIIQFIDYNYSMEAGHPYKFQAIPAVAIGIMILPLFDTMRVFVTRVIRGNSPFHADRRHIHHLLVDYGLSHMRATAVLVFINIMFISFVFSVHDKIDQHLLLIILIIIASTLTYSLHIAVVRKNRLKNLAS